MQAERIIRQLLLAQEDIPAQATVMNRPPNKHPPGPSEEDLTSSNHSNHEESPKRRRCSRCTQRTTWEQRLQQLREYKDKHGDLLIPIRFKENPSLGKFVHNTREQHKLYQKPPTKSRSGKAKKCSLTAERVRQLEELGFVWSTERSKHQKEDWEARLQQLKDYKAKHGDCMVPHGYQIDPSFAEWIHRQRTTYAHMVKDEEATHTKHHNPLIEDRMKQLEDLGFHFTVHADKWMEHWRELEHFRDTHGHCQVPTNCRQSPKLGRWVHTQRHQRRLQLRGKKSCMTDERVRMLDSLGFSWEVRPHPHHPNEEETGPTNENPVEDPLLVNVVGDDFHPEAESISGSISSADMTDTQATDLEFSLPTQQDGDVGSRFFVTV